MQRIWNNDILKINKKPMFKELAEAPLLSQFL